MARSRIKQIILEEALRAMLPYVNGWIETLGKVGAPPGRYADEFVDVAPGARVIAARDGINFLVKYLQSMDDDSPGQELLAALREAGAFALKFDEDTGGEVTDRPAYAQLGSQGANLA